MVDAGADIWPDREPTGTRRVCCRSAAVIEVLICFCCCCCRNEDEGDVDDEVERAKLAVVVLRRSRWGVDETTGS